MEWLKQHGISILIYLTTLITSLLLWVKGYEGMKARISEQVTDITELKSQHRENREAIHGLRNQLHAAGLDTAKLEERLKHVAEVLTDIRADLRRRD